MKQTHMTAYELCKKKMFKVRKKRGHISLISYYINIFRCEKKKWPLTFGRETKNIWLNQN